MAKIKVIIKRPDEEFGHVRNISASLESLQEIVNGYIEVVPLFDNVVAICDEDGKLKGRDRNLRFGMFARLVGTVIICGRDKDGEFTDVPIDFKAWKYLFEKGVIE